MPQEKENENWNIEDEVRDANARANRAQQEAVVLQDKLEAMEFLLAQTRNQLKETNTKIDAKDKRLHDIHLESAALSKSVGVLEERWSKLKVLQTTMNEKRDEMEAKALIALSWRNKDPNEETVSAETEALAEGQLNTSNIESQSLLQTSSESEIQSMKKSECTSVQVSSETVIENEGNAMKMESIKQVVSKQEEVKCQNSTISVDKQVIEQSSNQVQVSTTVTEISTQDP